MVFSCHFTLALYKIKEILAHALEDRNPIQEKDGKWCFHFVSETPIGFDSRGQELYIMRVVMSKDMLYIRSMYPVDFMSI